jgi:hypothetical protein
VFEILNKLENVTNNSSSHVSVSSEFFLLDALRDLADVMADSLASTVKSNTGKETVMSPNVKTEKIHL